jgi:hypothetical protein
MYHKAYTGGGGGMTSITGMSSLCSFFEIDLTLATNVRVHSNMVHDCRGRSKRERKRRKRERIPPTTHHTLPPHTPLQQEKEIEIRQSNPFLDRVQQFDAPFLLLSVYISLYVFLCKSPFVSVRLIFLHKSPT